jgi:hypothetical protein
MILKKARQVKKSRSCSSFSLTSRGLFTKHSSCQAKQSIPHTTVMFHGDCVKIFNGFTPNFDNKRTGCCNTTTHHLTLLFSPGNFSQKHITVVPHPPYFSVYPIEDKTERPPF